MLFQLVKKELIDCKKYVLIMFAVCIFFPVLLLWRSPEYAGQTWICTDNDFFNFHAFAILYL